VPSDFVKGIKVGRAERPPNWLEMSPDGKPWSELGRPPLHRRSLRDFRPRYVPEETKDERWTEWEERHRDVATAPCKKCGYETPMYFAGGLEGSRGQCPQCGETVRYASDDPDIDDGS
jgi:hypothetical protein